MSDMNWETREEDQEDGVEMSEEEQLPARASMETFVRNHMRTWLRQEKHRANQSHVQSGKGPKDPSVYTKRWDALNSIDETFEEGFVGEIAISYVIGVATGMKEETGSKAVGQACQDFLDFAQQAIGAAEQLWGIPLYKQQVAQEEDTRMSRDRQIDLSTPLVNMDAIPLFIEKAVEHYQAEGAPGWFTDWLEDMYLKFDIQWRVFCLDEVMVLQWLYQDGAWLPQSLAVNTAYKLFRRLGRDTTGILDY